MDGPRAARPAPRLPCWPGCACTAGNELTLSTLRLRGLGAGDDPGVRPTRRAASSSPAGCWPRSCGRCPPGRSTSPPTGPARPLKCGSATFTLMLLPEEEYPTLPEMPHAAGTVGGDAFASAISQVGHRRGPGRHAARADRHPDGDRRRHADPGRHRPVPAGGPRAALEPVAPGPQHAPCSSPPGCSATRRGADRRRRGVDRAAMRLGGDDGMIGFEGAGRQTTTRLLSGEYPSTRRCCPASSARSPSSPAGSFAEAVKRVALVAERNTPVRLAFSSGQLVLEAGSRRGGAGGGGRSRRLRRRATCRSPSTRSTCSTASAAIDSDTARISFTSPTKPAVITGKSRGRARLPVRAHADPLGG